MIKLFKRLVSALKKLGTRVVYADFTRIIVHTDKEDLPSAREYIDFVLGAVCSRELFGFLEISPKTYWEQVLWLGPDNWGAILLVDTPTSPEELDDTEDDQDVEDAAAADAERNEDDGSGADGHHDNNADDAEQEWDEDQGGTTQLPGLAVAHNTPSKHKNLSAKQHPGGLGPGKKGSVTFAKDVLSPVGKKTVDGGSSGKNKRNQNDQSNDEYAFLDTLLSKKSTTKRSKGDRNKQRDVDDDDAFDEDEDDEDDDDEEEEEQDDDDDDRRSGGNDNNGSGNNSGGGQEEDSSDPLLQAHWTLAQYLPPAAAEYFFFIVGNKHPHYPLYTRGSQHYESYPSRYDHFFISCCQVNFFINTVIVDKHF